MTMQIHLLKGKLHRALVTDANVEYEGSLTIDHDLMDKVRLLPVRARCLRQYGQRQPV